VEQGLLPFDAMGIDTTGKHWAIAKPFTKVRQAIDAMDDTPPLPRIELNPAMVDGLRPYRLYADDEFSTPLARKEIDALSQLAGRDLPIYSPKSGSLWTQLYPLQLEATQIAQETGTEYWPDGIIDKTLAWIDALDVPATIWRYTK